MPVVDHLKEAAERADRESNTLRAAMTSTARIQLPATDDIGASFEAAWAEPVPMGALVGEVVFLLRASRDIKIGKLIFPVDHPYVRSTKLWAEAKRLLGEQT